MSGLETGTVFGKFLVFLAHIMVVFSFIAIYEAHGMENNVVSLLSIVFGVVGTIIVSAIVFVEMAGARGVEVSGMFEGAISKGLVATGPMLFVIGVVMLGSFVMYARIFPRLGGLLLIIGTAVFALGSIIGYEAVFSVIGGGITALGFIILGIALLKGVQYSTYRSIGM